MDHNTTPIGELIKVFFRKNGLSERLSEVDLNQKWEEIAGEIISKHTKTIKLKNRKLILGLDSAALRHTLSFSKTEFIQKLNESMGKNLIDDIEFK